MAQKQRFLDVWIVETNVVYREVPFAVVADWLQQGRLLEDDLARPSGTKDWAKLGGIPGLAPYLPRPEPLRPQDQAEALEPVQIDFAWKHRHDEEEEDPDMIPLIDVSLVLLIFFMMTASSVAIAAAINTPAAYYGLVTSRPDLLTIGIECGDDREPTVYWVAQGDKLPDPAHKVKAIPGDREMQIPQAFLDLLDRRLAETDKQVEVVIKTDERLKDGYYLNLLIELEKRRLKVKQKYDGVREKTAP